MKKVLSFVAVAAFLLFAGNANAQLSIHAGYQNYSLHANGYSASDDGFYAGLSYNLEAGGGLGIAPGAYFTYVEDIIDVRVPILMNYVIHFNDFGIGAFLGPNVTIGLAGDAYGDGDGYMRRFDLGLTFGAQLSYQKFSFELGYNMGLLKRYKDTEIKSNQFFVGVGYAL